MVTKVILSIVAVFVGVIAFGVIRDTVGHGQHFVSAAIVIALWMIWKKSSASE